MNIVHGVPARDRRENSSVSSVAHSPNEPFRAAAH